MLVVSLGGESVVTSLDITVIPPYCNFSTSLVSFLFFLSFS